MDSKFLKTVDEITKQESSLNLCIEVLDNPIIMRALEKIQKFQDQEHITTAHSRFNSHSSHNTYSSSTW